MASTSYEIPNSGKLSLNSDILLDYDEKYVTQYLQLIGVSAKSLKDDLKHLEEWYAKQPHLPEDPIIKRRLFQYLILTGMSVEKTKLKVDNYYSLRNKIPEFLKNRDPCAHELESELQYPIITVLPKRTPEHHRIVLHRLKGPRSINAQSLSKVGFMWLDYRFYNEVSLGEHWMYDCRNASLSNMVELSSMMAKNIFIWANGYATKVKGIHITNMPSYAEPLFNLFKKLMKKKMVDRFHIYNKFEDLFEVFPKSIFPSDVGGDEKSCDEINDAWVKTLQSPEWRAWFIAQDDICADESKRLEPSRFDDSDLFGVDGSFKELTID